MLRAALLFLFLAPQSAAISEIPIQLRGDWKVTRVIPTATITCWDDSQAKKLLDTTIHYYADGFLWNDHVVRNATVNVNTLSAKQFHREYSGGGAADSQVDFRQLGIRAPDAVVVTVEHDPANITGGSIEIPGDWVLLKNHDTLILSVCNVYFEARRR